LSSDVKISTNVVGLATEVHVAGFHDSCFTDFGTELSIFVATFKVNNLVLHFLAAALTELDDPRRFVVTDGVSDAWFSRLSSF
jgi:hypothetical protein